MDRGWIKLWRKSKDSAIFSHEGLWKLWCLCLMKASHKEIEVPVTGLLQPVKLFPGQFITGRDALHYDYHQGNQKKRYNPKLRPSKKTLFRFLLALGKMQNLTIKTTNKYSIVSITNWEAYQGNDHQMGKQVTTNKNDKEILYEGDFFSISKKQHQKYEEAYPSLDLVGEYKAMDAWLESNPSKRKTQRGYPRFVNGWLSREHKKLQEKKESNQGNWYDKYPDL